MFTSILLLVLGFLLLGGGAELLVRGSTRLAIQLGVSPVVVGLTIVALGTSAPELAVSVYATLNGASGLALGNVVGSNIANIGLVLGLMALLYPLTIDRASVRQDIPLAIGSFILLLFLIVDKNLIWQTLTADDGLKNLIPPDSTAGTGLNNLNSPDSTTGTGTENPVAPGSTAGTGWHNLFLHELGFIDGLLLTSGLIAFVAYSYLHARGPAAQSPAPAELSQDSAPTGIPVLLLYVLAGLALLVFGSNLFVDSAINIARMLHVSDAIIGITLVAVGTSIPELATCLVAAYRKQPGLAVGNIIGSNLFNVLGILGITALTGTVSAAEFAWIDFAVALGFSLILLPMVYTKLTLSRLEGALLLLAYVVYICYLVLRG